MISYYKTLYMCTYIQYIYLYMYIFIHTKKKKICQLYIFIWTQRETLTFCVARFLVFFFS